VPSVPKIPPRAANPVSDLRKARAPIEGLVVVALASLRARVQLVELRKVCVVRRGPKKFSTRPGHSMHFQNGHTHIENVFNRLARSNQIEGIVGKRQLLHIAMNQGHR
jgi:hypothetical protein